MRDPFTAQRKFLRVAWRIPVQIQTSTDEEIFNATTFNISAGGLCLLPSQPLPVETRVVVQFHLPQGFKEREVKLDAEVVREMSGLGEARFVGLAFLDVPPRERLFLRACVLGRALAQVQMISEYPAFHELSDLDLLGLASVSHELELWPGEPIAHFGDEATSLFLVKKGAVELRVPVEEGDEQTVVEIARAGQVFGEASALLGLPHNLDMLALEDTELLVIPRAALWYLRDQNPQLALVLHEIFASFMGRRLRRLTGRLVSPLSTE